MHAILGDVRQAALQFHVPIALILAVIETESDFCADAVSAAGACGLMQILPETFSWLRDEQLQESLADSAIFDPAVNIRYGTYYLAYLQAKFSCTETVLAAYNAGEGRVGEWLCDPSLSTDGTSLSRIPYPETARYVERAGKSFQKFSKKYPF